MLLIRKILLILGGIILLEGLLVSLPRTVDASCEAQWACSPSCSSTLHCEWFPSGGYGYCGNPDYGSYGPVNCSVPILPDWPCGRVWVPGVEADCDRFGTNETNCTNGYPNSGWRGCAGSPGATPTPTSPPAEPTNTPTPTPTNTPTPTPTNTPIPTPTPTNTPTPTPLPTIPMPTGICSDYVPSNHRYSVTWNWQSMLGAINYWLQSYNNNSPVDWFINAWIGNITSKIVSNVPAEKTNYGKVAWTNDPSYTNISQFSPNGSVYCPLPTLYPTVAVSGNLREYLGAACYNNISTNTLSININPQIPAGVTSNCGVTPPTGQTKSSYRCTVVFDNQNAAPTPAQNLNLSALATGYSSAYWTAANACTDTANNSLPVDVSSGGSTVYNKDVFFKNISAWIKLKNSSFSSIGSLINILPLNIAAYDSDDDVSQRYFIMNSTGNDPGLVSASSIDTGTADVSSKNWKADYTMQPALTPLGFKQYVKARKKYTTIITDISEITADGIYFYNGALILNNINLNQATSSKFVLIVDGNVTINQDKFNISDNCASASILKSIAILSKTGTISFSNTTQCAAGIFIAQTINTGPNTSQGLKIKGNLVAFSSFVNGREWSDNSQPSVFIVFDPVQYINLLPYLSTASYDWRQLQ